MKAAKVDDIGTEHDGYPPTKITAGSPNVFIDGKPAARVGDPLEPHDKPNSPKHDRAIATGSSTVFINGKPAALTGGKVTCGGVTIGSGTVNIGDVPPPTQNKKVKSTEYDRLVKFDKEIDAKLITYDGVEVIGGKGKELQTPVMEKFENLYVVWEEK
ncbi:type VI secretion system PAAR protein [Halodesulfovibrio sp.]|jgi:uncharacterized Zn-binding protein involved in type VI secretion|uniref:type VI secretion system PAAR protein n=1 Tax=Halodesulfovibrio sp. TaxID=1912772 RepID=UPI0025D84E43|nr:type VI secretion system PAAR protein [Halodesulfovibrio sp.]MCT4535170.1 type VI secretion system PAAR protein [Halodesulfovibrio sp.]